MNNKDADFLKRLLATFKIEAEEHINALSSGLIELEKTTSREKRIEITESVFREVHSLKGAARAVNMADIEAICQAIESVFAAVKREEVVLSPELFDLLHQSNDSLSRLLSDMGVEQKYAEKARLDDLIGILRVVAEGTGVSRPSIETVIWKSRAADSPVRLKSGKARPRKQKVKVDKLPEAISAVDSIVPADRVEQEAIAQKTDVPEVIRVSKSKLIPILLQTEELLLSKLAAGEQVNELDNISSDFARWKSDWVEINRQINDIIYLLNKEESLNESIKINSDFNRLLEFLEQNHTSIRSLENKLETLSKSLKHNYRSLSSVIDTLLKDTKQVLMLPFSSILEGFPKLVRDLSRDQNKEVELVVGGTDVEIDRRILEEMKDSLIHIVRNCIDHGIEKPEERVDKKKPRKGLVRITVGQKNSHAEVVISDDGAGIDISKVKAVSLGLNILAPDDEKRITDMEAISLVFQSGVTTSPIITDLSGRGLGLAIVQEKIAHLGGEISLESTPDTGTMFRIILPLTLATFRGVIVRVSGHLFVLPTTNIEQVSRVNKQLIKTVENKTTIELNDKAISLVKLADVMEFPRDTTDNASDYVSIVVLASAENRIAFLIDEVVNEQEVLVKNLGRQLSRVRNVAGATILGTGKVVLILNTLDLLKSAVNIGEVSAVPAIPLTKETEMARQSILVVEDSITSRTLLKNILETAGYDVNTAVDGVDAYSQLRTGKFNLVVSDVDMPRMNGFDLTMKIRNDKKYKELPVVLVTALDSREDRERGIEVGADAYIVKSNFDQSNLLEVVGRLV